MPASVRRYLVTGLNVLAKLDTSKVASLIPLALSTYTADVPSDREFDRLAKEFGINRNQVPEFLGAINLITSVLSERPESAEDFVKEAKNAGLVGEENLQNVKQFAELAIANRDIIKKQIDQEEVASEVLPTFTYFETTIDVRLTFSEEGRIERTMPVALVHIDTDSREHEIWFQMSRSQAERVIEDLRAIVSKLQTAESFGKSGA